MKEHTIILWLILSCCIYEIGGDWKVFVTAFIATKAYLLGKKHGKMLSFYLNGLRLK